VSTSSVSAWMIPDTMIRGLSRRRPVSIWRRPRMRDVNGSVQPRRWNGRRPGGSRQAYRRRHQRREVNGASQPRGRSRRHTVTNSRRPRMQEVNGPSQPRRRRASARSGKPTAAAAPQWPCTTLRTTRWTVDETDDTPRKGQPWSARSYARKPSTPRSELERGALRDRTTAAQALPHGAGSATDFAPDRRAVYRLAQARTSEQRTHLWAPCWLLSSLSSRGSGAERRATTTLAPRFVAFGVAAVYPCGPTLLRPRPSLSDGSRTSANSLSASALGPIARSSSSMGHGHDLDRIGIDAKEDDVGKARDELSTVRAIIAPRFAR